MVIPERCSSIDVLLEPLDAFSLQKLILQKSLFPVDAGMLLFEKGEDEKFHKGEVKKVIYIYILVVNKHPWYVLTNQENKAEVT